MWQSEAQFDASSIYLKLIIVILTLPFLHAVGPVMLDLIGASVIILHFINQQRLSIESISY